MTIILFNLCLFLSNTAQFMLQKSENACRATHEMIGNLRMLCSTYASGSVQLMVKVITGHSNARMSLTFGQLIPVNFNFWATYNFKTSKSHFTAQQKNKGYSYLIGQLMVSETDNLWFQSQFPLLSQPPILFTRSSGTRFMNQCPISLIR